MDSDQKEEMAEQLQVKVGHISQLETIYQIFSKGEDEIQNKELGAIMRELGANPTEEEVQDMINELEDGDVSGSMECPEFIRFSINKMKADGAEDQLKRAFGLMNASKSGGITSDELKVVMEKAGQKLTDADIEDMMKELGGGTGVVSYAAFAKCMQNSISAPWPVQ
eukprot:g1673.t1